MKFRYIKSNGELIAEVSFTWCPPKVEVINYTDDKFIRPFGSIKNPTIEDLEWFLEDRCFPRTRDHLKIILKDLNLDFYEPIEIIKKTEGRLAEDDMYLKIVEE